MTEPVASDAVASPGPQRRPFDRLSPTMRFGMAIFGLVVGLLLVYVGARSCEEGLQDDPPVPTMPTPSVNSAN